MSGDAKKEQTEFEKVMESLRNYICNRLCKYTDSLNISRDELNRQCKKCKAVGLTEQLLSMYNEINDFTESQCYILLKENNKLKTDRDYWKAEAQKNAAKLGEVRILLGDV